MFVVAGVIFMLAMFLLFVDKWFDHASIDLTAIIRLLIIISTIGIGIHYFLQMRV